MLKGVVMHRFSIVAPVLVGVLGAASAGVAAASGWSIQRTPNPPAGTNEVAGVSCTSASACTAVGYDGTGHTGTTRAERWNGAKWSIQPTPNPGSNGGLLTGVSCSSRSACAAVGYYSTPGPLQSLGTLAERWNGTRWSIQPTPNPGGDEDSVLDGVSCTSPSACTAVGYYIITGNTFTEQGPPPATLAERWNGISWSIQPTPNPGSGSTLTGVSCTSPSACTAVGYYFTGNTSATLAERWNGNTWSIQPTPNPGSRGSLLNGVSCTSGSACTAVGYYVTGNTQATLAERWNGTTWSIQPTPNAGRGSGLDGVSCTSGSACTAVGGNGPGGVALAGATLAERWNGTRWSIQHTPNPAPLSGLLGVSCTSGSACTAVGVYAHPYPHNRRFAERWSGG